MKRGGGWRRVSLWGLFSSPESFAEKVPANARQKLLQAVGEVKVNFYARFLKRNQSIFIEYHGLRGEAPTSARDLAEKYGLDKNRIFQIVQVFYRELSLHPEVRKLAGRK